MRVQTLEAFPIKIKTGVDLRGGTFSYDNFMTVLIRVTCDGQEGWGEAMTRFSPSSTAAMVEEYFSPQLIGKEIREPSSLWNILFRALQVRGHTRGIAIEALSGIEIALWDAYGQLFKKSVSEILGKNIPRRKKVDAYAGSIYSSLGDIEGQIDHIKQRGFKGAKVKIGLGIEKDLKLLKSIRKHWEAGNIVADANCAYQVDEAIQASAMFSQVGISWFEEPISPEDISGYSRLSKETKVPVGPRLVNGIGDLLELGIIPDLRGIYRQDLLALAGRTEKEERAVDAVIPSHAHSDHADYVSLLREDIPVYMGSITKTILESIQDERNRDIEFEITLSI